jgi:hypothetical protein
LLSNTRAAARVFFSGRTRFPSRVLRCARGTYTSHMTGIVSSGTGVGAHLGDFVMTALIYIAIEMTKLVDRWRVASRGHPTSACLAVSSAERQSVPPLT